LSNRVHYVEEEISNYRLSIYILVFDEKVDVFEFQQIHDLGERPTLNSKIGDLLIKEMLILGVGLGTQM